jgi:hypothetical protein
MGHMDEIAKIKWTPLRIGSGVTFFVGMTDMPDFFHFAGDRDVSYLRVVVAPIKHAVFI